MNDSSKRIHDIEIELKNQKAILQATHDREKFVNALADNHSTLRRLAHVLAEGSGIDSTTIIRERVSQIEATIKRILSCATGLDLCDEALRLLEGGES